MNVVIEKIRGWLRGYVEGFRHEYDEEGDIIYTNGAYSTIISAIVWAIPILIIVIMFTPIVLILELMAKILGIEEKDI
jgi:heme/copper-type cytochrome/quinol oxidase subunit 2